jgi:anti-anti-sigma factor
VGEIGVGTGTGPTGGASGRHGSSRPGPSTEGVDHGHSLRYAVGTGRDEITLKVTGEVDLANARAFEDELLEALHSVAPRERVIRFTVDLTGVSYLGSDGIRALVRAHRTAAGMGTQWHVEPSQIVGVALRAAGLGQWTEP